ncbi:hypothetical protein JRQ81_007223 [Phrynocephalus forsythii]|uniref:Rho-GAP domain-containing protein n=1 Tax=Phrynocephalus forsythii TaxID=171643 RepID=A0A9Q0XDR0_9SAUR|nr:hypothetical protein JRQ81_007223 [Phrynocephalus forsythii]
MSSHSCCGCEAEFTRIPGHTPLLFLSGKGGEGKASPLVGHGISAEICSLSLSLSPAPTRPHPSGLLLRAKGSGKVESRKGCCEPPPCPGLLGTPRGCTMVDHSRIFLTARDPLGAAWLQGRAWLTCTKGDQEQTQRLAKPLCQGLGREAEAKKACAWLRAAGFPQYAQLYEESCFPLDIASVKKDHSFLDRDSLKSLCRRLMTLNSCASMKLEVHFQRKQNDDSDEEDFCAISDQWAFQRDSKRWSRLGSGDFLSCSLERGSPMRKVSSQESVLTDLSTDLEAASLHSSTCTGSARGTLLVMATPPEPALSPGFGSSTPRAGSPSPAERSPSLSGSSSKEKPKKRRTRSFLKRIESLRRKDKEKPDSAKGREDQGREAKSWQDLSKDAGGDPERDKAAPPGRGPLPSAQGDTTLPSRGKQTKWPLGAAEGHLQPEPKCPGVYLEDYKARLGKARGWEAGGKYQDPSPRDFWIHVPGDYKPGTFPKSLSIESLCPIESGSLADWRTSSHRGSLMSRVVPSGGGGGSSSSLDHQGPQSLACQQRERRRRRRSPPCSPTGSCASLYDNVPDFGSGDDLFDLDSETIYENLDDILEHVWDLQQKVELWSRTIRLDLEGGEDLAAEAGEEETDSGGEPAHLHLEERSMSDIGTSASDFDSTANSLNDMEDVEMRERRDSGVGASLTRPCRKLRWHSFQNSHRPSLNSASLEINRQSAAQLNLLQKCSLLRLTAIMEKYSLPQKQTWAWTVPKFMKRSKTPDYRGKMVFGVAPMVNVQRTGQPLPQSIQQAMRYLRGQCLDQVGIFRKSGVKSRIQALRHLNEASPDHVNYEGQSAYDVADLLKQYFRDLPEPIFTNKLTETFLQIYQFVPKEQRLPAVQAAVALMPDENREVLQTLLYFLSDIASAEGNQMTSGNLAVCLAPSLFHLNVSKKESTSPRVMHKRGPAGKPAQKDLNENMAATQGLSHMIAECKKRNSSRSPRM